MGPGLKTKVRGASKRRVMTISRSAVLVAAPGLLAAMFFLLTFQFAQIVVQTIEALFQKRR